MWIQVRLMDGSRSARFDGLSKLTKIEQLREKIETEFEVSADRQRLFYRGKQLEDGHSLFDYSVGLNEIIQLMVRGVPPPVATTASASNESEAAATSSNEERDEEPMDASAAEEEKKEEEIEGAFFRVGDDVDARDLRCGAWFESTVKRITKGKGDSLASNGGEASEESTSSAQAASNGDGNTADTIYYHILFDGYDDNEVTAVTADNVRCRAKKALALADLKVGEQYMVNHNCDSPKDRGMWYDAIVTSKDVPKKVVMARLMLGSGIEGEEVQLVHLDVYRIEKNGETSEGDGEKRSNMPECRWCKDVPTRKCKHCACVECGGKDAPEKQILCDECDDAYHLWCLNPPMAELPEEDEWYCPDCKTDTGAVIKAGEKLRVSKKKSKMASKQGSCSRDWGKGMACMGRTKVCTIVPTNHFGPIPGVPVGSLWRFRVQVSEAGVHRPHVSGIAGRSEEGAFSLVLAGGYEDDKDNGNEFYYTGSGGRDLSGNKREAKQSSDQQLTLMNKALAKNCDVAMNDKTGGSAKDWKKGKPVRVVRSAKGKKHSQFAPDEGCRYDGMYKIVKYWPEKGAAGFKVWRYFLRRDDPSPAPWTTEGKKNIKKLGLTLQYPDGYLEGQALKEKEKAAKRKHSEVGGEEGSATPSKKRAKKGEASSSPSKSPKSSSSSPAKDASPAKTSGPVYRLAKEERELIKKDSQNKKLWDNLLRGKEEDLLKRVEETFLCICCQDVVFHPVSTPCKHNVCKACLHRSFKAKVFCCPACRGDLDRKMSLAVNGVLSETLLALFPGYGAGR